MQPQSALYRLSLQLGWSRKGRGQDHWPLCIALLGGIKINGDLSRLSIRQAVAWGLWDCWSMSHSRTCTRGGRGCYGIKRQAQSCVIGGLGERLKSGVTLSSASMLPPSRKCVYTAQAQDFTPRGHDQARAERCVHISCDLNRQKMRFRVHEGHWCLPN